MTPLALLLVLQAAAFQKHLDEAQVLLGLPPIKAVVTRNLTPEFSVPSPYAAWVQPNDKRTVYVRPDFLNAHPLILEVVAYHEVCHLYIGVDHIFSKAETHLHHLMIDGCVEWLLGPRHHQVMQAIPCGKWYPDEALRYNRRIRKELCQ